MTRSSTTHRLVFAVATGLVVMVFAYVAVRVIDVALNPEPNPAIVVWTDRSRFVWRALIASYLGGAAIFGGFALASRARERSVVWLERMIVGAAIALLVQAACFP